MSNPYVSDAGSFLLTTLFGLYILIVMLRFILQLVHADFYNPLSQFLVKASNPPLRILRRFIPGYAGIDLASVTLLLGLKMLELYLLVWLRGGSAALPGILVYAGAELLGLVINIFLVTIIIEIVISWVNPGAYNPATRLIAQINQPLMRPARRLLPPMSGIDFSPIVVIIGLQLGSMLIVAPLRDLAAGMM